MKKGIVLSVLAVLIISVLIGFEIHKSNERQLRTDIALDYLKIVAIMQEFYETDVSTIEDVNTWYRTIAEKVRIENNIYQKRYYRYRDWKYSKRKTLKEFLDSVDYLVEGFIKVGQAQLTTKELIQTQLVNDKLLENAMGVVSLITKKKTGKDKLKLIITKAQKNEINDYIHSVFGAEISKYENIKIKPQYIWGMKIILEMLDIASKNEQYKEEDLLKDKK